MGSLLVWWLISYITQAAAIKKNETVKVTAVQHRDMVRLLQLFDGKIDSKIGPDCASRQGENVCHLRGGR